MTAIAPGVASLRARVAGLSRCVSTGERQADDPDLLNARRDLAALMLEERIKRTMAESPPLTKTQVQRLCGLIRR